MHNVVAMFCTPRCFLSFTKSIFQLAAAVESQRFDSFHHTNNTMLLFFLESVIVVVVVVPFQNTTLQADLFYHMSGHEIHGTGLPKLSSNVAGVAHMLFGPYKICL